MDGLPEFAEIHVISDIHMGGKLGFQILRETQRLANFIRWVAISWAQAPLICELPPAPSKLLGWSCRGSEYIV